MKEMKSFWKFIFSIFGIGCLLYLMVIIVHDVKNISVQHSENVLDTNYGSFLAAQHALYINDFASASEMIQNIKSDVSAVKDVKDYIDFFSGKMPENVSSMKQDKDLAKKLIYDAHLIQKNDWKSIYQRHGKDSSIFTAPLRIFSAVHQGKTKEALDYIDSLKTNKSWKAFIRGQVAVLNKDIDKAAKEFADVHPDFMNINDYLYLMSFYRANDMLEDMDILRNDFIAKPGGMLVLDYQDIPDWSEYDGYKNNLVFSIVQTISHTQILIFTDLSLMMLRFAEIITDDYNIDMINYYLGQYYFYNSGDYKSAFNKISKTNPLYLFGQMKIAEKAGDFKKIQNIAYNNPVFISAVNSVIKNDIKNGNKRSAIHLLNRALNYKGLHEMGRAYFLKQRANVYLMFNRPDDAQKDLKAAAELDDRLLPDVMLLQARIWTQQNRNLADAYNYVMSLIKTNTSDVIAWDALGVIVEKREGVDAALEVLERVGEVAATASSLFEHLGDLHIKKGNIEKAKKAYQRAIDLSDDGLVVVPVVKKKLRKLK